MKARDLFGLAILSAVGAWLLTPLPLRPQGRMISCQSNVKNIATALAMYASDNGGRYPFRLADLQTGNYLKIPSCPSTGRDTYSAAYRAGGKKFIFGCQGNNHSHLYPPNFPRYSSNQGLLLK